MAAALFRATPLVRSLPLSTRAGRDVLLKLEFKQVSGSFKDRGISHLCSEMAQTGIKGFVSSSGGNAGHSVACMGKLLGASVHVIVPETTKPLMLEKIRSQDAQVTVHGENWNAADQLARELVEKDQELGYVPPYDHPLIWKGHASMIEELEVSEPPSAVIVSVGGGGLLCGVLEGLKNRWPNEEITVIAAETHGTRSFGLAVEKGKTARLERIEGVATSLGALEVTPATLERSAEHNGRVIPIQVSDEEALEACCSFAEDPGALVEPACGAALATLYTDTHMETVKSHLTRSGPIVAVVCGGSAVNDEIHAEWKQRLNRST